jgi:hypothetical protein
MAKAFSLQIAEFIVKTKADTDTVLRMVLFKIDQRLVMRSPVGDASYWQRPAPKGYSGGRFRGAWVVSEWTPNTSEGGLSRLATKDNWNIDKDGSATLAAHANIIGNAKAGRIYYLMNNVPYSERIEKGWSRQAPNGLVMLTVIEFRTMFDDAINGVRNGTSAADFAQGWETYKP